MLLAVLTQTSRTVAAQSSRRAKIACIAALLRGCPQDEIGRVALWLTGETGPVKLGVGPAQVRAALETRSASEPTLTVTEAAQRLDAIASISGSGSRERRALALAQLFAVATAEEHQFLARLILGELRQGALTALVTDAVAVAFNLPADAVRRAQMLRGDIGEVATIACREGRAGLEALRLSLFRPLQPMLAQPAEDIDDAVSRLDRPVLEYKLDGARVQIHKRGDEVRVYSRQGNEVTAAVPEIVSVIGALPESELVLDGETLALSSDGSPLPFQTSMRRFGRRSDDPELRARLPLTLYCFDCLACGGETLIDQPTLTRHAALADAVPASLIIPRIEATCADKARAFFAQALGAGHEGLMAKDRAAPYAAGGRGSHWLKIKQAQTLDLVVLAAEWGSGRRQGWLSNLHLGARDADGGFVMLGKTFKGLTDERLAWQTMELLRRETERDGTVVHVRPELVVEIAFNELQQSRQYPGGLALRFARVKRYRTDKTAADADSLALVRALFERQIAYRDAAASDG